MNINNSVKAINEVAKEFFMEDTKLIFDGRKISFKSIDNTRQHYCVAYVKNNDIQVALKVIAKQVHRLYLEDIKYHSILNDDRLTQSEIEHAINDEYKRCEWAKIKLGDLLKD